MSKTQQEIAAPQARKIYQNITITALSILLTAISTFLIYAYQSDMFSTRTALAITVTVVLSLLVIAAAIVCVIYKTAIYAAVFGLFAVFCFIFILVLAWLETNNYKIFLNLTTAIATNLVALVAFILLTLTFLKLNKRSRLNVIATLSGAVFAISMTLCFYLYNPAFTAARDIINPLYYLIAVASALALICVIVCIATSSRKIITTKWITYCAMFSALAIVVKVMGNAVSFVPELKFSLVYIPWVIAGIVLGPSGGMVAALVSDVLGQLILPSGFSDVNPLTTLSNTLFPLFPAIMYKYSLLKKDWLNILVGILVSTIVCTLGIGSYALWIKYYNYMDFWVYWSTKRLFQPLIIIGNYIIIMSLIPVLSRLKLTKMKFWQLKISNHKA